MKPASTGSLIAVLMISGCVLQRFSSGYCSKTTTGETICIKREDIQCRTFYYNDYFWFAIRPEFWEYKSLKEEHFLKTMRCRANGTITDLAGHKKQWNSRGAERIFAYGSLTTYEPSPYEYCFYHKYSDENGNFIDAVNNSTFACNAASHYNLFDKTIRNRITNKSSIDFE